MTIATQMFRENFSCTFFLSLEPAHLSMILKYFLYVSGQVTIMHNQCSHCQRWPTKYLREVTLTTGGGATKLDEICRSYFVIPANEST